VSSVPKAPSTTRTGFEIRHHFKLNLYHGYEHHLCNAIAGFNGECAVAAIPARHEHLALVIGIDETHKVAEHDTVLVPEAGAWQQYRCERWIANMNRDPGWNEMCLARFERQCLVQAGHHVEAGRTVGAISGEREFIADARVEDFECDFLHGTVLLYVE